MNYIKRIMSSLLIGLLAVVLCTTAKAEEKEADLFYNNQIQDIGVFIEYEKDDVTFTIISPSGQQITSTTDTDNITVNKGSTSTIVYIKSAEVGQWKIRYDKGSNEKISVSASKQDNSFWIDSFSIGQLDALNSLPLTFKVTGNETNSYQYRISLVTSLDTISGKELTWGYGNINEVVNLNLNMDSVNSYDNYYLLLQVNYQYNDTEYFDIAYSDKFTYTNPNAPAPLNTVIVTVDHSSNIVTFDCSYNYDIDSIYSEYYYDDVLAGSSSTEANDKSIQIPFEDTTKKLTVKLSGRNDYSGLITDMVEYNIDLANPEIKFNFPANGLVPSNIWTFSYECSTEKDVTFTIKDTTSSVERLSGSGEKYITLPNDRNTIDISYVDGNGYNHLYSRIANVSKITPTLTLTNKLDGVVTTNDYILITGKTNGTTLTINGKEIEFTDDIFSHKFPLEKGENSIEIIASIGDNSSAITARVTKEDVKLFSPDNKLFKFGLPVVIGLLLSLAGIIVNVTFSKKKAAAATVAATAPAQGANSKNLKAAKSPKKKASLGSLLVFVDVLLWIISITLWVIFIVRKVFEGGKKFLELAYKSLPASVKYLNTTTAIMVWAIILVSLAFVLTITLIVLKTIKSSKNKRLQMGGMAPTVNTVSQMENTAPVVNNAPQVDNTAPVVNNAPQVDNTAPEANNVNNQLNIPNNLPVGNNPFANK